jgi:P4 family phage/plasmid primase-like protien
MDEENTTPASAGMPWFKALTKEEQDLVASYIKSKPIGMFNIANHIISKYNIVTIGEKMQEIFVYIDGMYREAENVVVFPEIQRLLGHFATKGVKTEIQQKIADLTARSRDIFTTAEERYIPLRNGVYDLETATLLPHDPKYYFKYQFPILYDPAAQCHKTSDFFDQVLTKDQRSTMEEWLGYLFLRNYMFKKAVIMVGEGDTGKTTLLEVITNLVGKENIAGVSLHKMSADRFAMSQLYGKHVNIWDELSAGDITDSGAFKMATGGGTLTGEYKFGNQFSFNNFAKLTFACNRIPDVTDFSDEAYFNRWMVIRFEKTIAKKILNFIRTLTTEEERSGLFNLAMVGLKRLLTNHSFTYASSATDTKMEMMRNGSSIAQFVQERIERDATGVMTNEEMYELYSQFCEDNGLNVETNVMLGGKLPLYASYCIKSQVQDPKAPLTSPRQCRGWRGVRVRLTVEEMQENERMTNWLDDTANLIQKKSEMVIQGV